LGEPYNMSRFYFIPFLLVILFGCLANQNLQASSLLSPAEGQLYHGVYPGGKSGEEDDLLPADLQAYEASVGRKVAWVYFSNNWFRSRAFPLETATWIRAEGAVPFVRLMLRSSSETYVEEAVFTLDAILAGKFDSDFSAWAQEAAKFASPVIVEWGTEMNGDWFSWNASSNGEQKGAIKFANAYRHIIDTMRAAGAKNLIWVFHVNADDSPEEPWNKFEAYYPGDDYIDWLGVSAYGTQSPEEDEITSLADWLDSAVPRLSSLAPTKPIYLLEFGSSVNPYFDPTIWANEALSHLLSNRWPEIKGFAWWNETWQNDDDPSHDTNMQVQSVPGLADVFQKYLTSNKIISAPLLP
jgi:hypothetical protein